MITTFSTFVFNALLCFNQNNSFSALTTLNYFDLHNEPSPTDINDNTVVSWFSEQSRHGICGQYLLYIYTHIYKSVPVCLQAVLQLSYYLCFVFSFMYSTRKYRKLLHCTVFSLSFTYLSQFSKNGSSIWCPSKAH